MYAQTQHLYILPDTYKKLLDSPEEQISTLAQRFFKAPASSPAHHLPICELLTNYLAFAQYNLQDFAACALFSTLVDVHAQNYNYPNQQLSELALQQILEYTLEIPNFHISCLTYEQAVRCAEFVEEFYCSVAEFYRFLFAPQAILQVSVEQQRGLNIVHSMKQLGASDLLPPPDAKNRAASRSRPSSKQTAKQPDSDEYAHDAEACQITLLPLDSGIVYVPPPPPTKEETQEKELKEAVKEVQESVSAPAEKTQEVDVDKMAKAIQLAAQQELERVRGRIMTELESGGKKGAKK